MTHGVLGLNAGMFEDYFKFIANRRCSQISLPMQYKNTDNPFPWKSEVLDLKKEKTFLRHISDRIPNRGCSKLG